MNPIMRWTLLAGGVAALAACDIVHPQAFNSEGVNYRSVRAQGQSQTFNQALAQGYADFARWEVQQGDYRDGKYNLDKARLAAAGTEVAPVDPTRRNIRPQDRQEVVSAYDQLTKALGGDAKTREPGFAGAAQVYFDCWVEQLEEGHQPQHIAYCRDGFQTAMNQLAPRQAAAAPAPQPQAAAPARPFLVFFDWDKATLNASAQPTIDEIAKTISQGRPATIRLAGHADKSGPDPYNMSLSERRAQTVMNALAQKGIRKDQVRIEYFGESRPLVPTADGVREAQNRRVEVTFQ